MSILRNTAGLILTLGTLASGVAWFAQPRSGQQKRVQGSGIPDEFSDSFKKNLEEENFRGAYRLWVDRVDQIESSDQPDLGRLRDLRELKEWSAQNYYGRMSLSRKLQKIFEWAQDPQKDAARLALARVVGPQTDKEIKRLRDSTAIRTTPFMVSGAFGLFGGVATLVNQRGLRAGPAWCYSGGTAAAAFLLAMGSVLVLPLMMKIKTDLPTL